jgi:transposase
VAFEVVDRFVAAKFTATEERFVRRFQKVLAIEAKYLRRDYPAKQA